MPLKTISEDIPAGSTGWFQKIVDRWSDVNANFAFLLSQIGSVATAAVKSVNGLAPDGGGNVTLSVGAPADVQVFTASGTWTKPTGAKYVYVLVFGGGCSGAAIRRASYDASNLYYAAGGAGGGMMEGLLPAAGLPSSVPVTVGAGGAAPTLPAGSSVSTLPCNSGGDSSFGGVITATGGKTPATGTADTTNSTSQGAASIGGYPLGSSTTRSINNAGNDAVPLTPWHGGGGAVANAGYSSAKGAAGGGGTYLSQYGRLGTAYNGGAVGSDVATVAVSATASTGDVTAPSATSRTGTGRAGSGGAAASLVTAVANTTNNVTAGSGAIPGGGGGTAQSAHSDSAGGSPGGVGAVTAGSGGRGEVIVVSIF